MDQISIKRIAILRSLLKRGVVKFIYRDTNSTNICSYGTANQGMTRQGSLPSEYRRDPSKDFVADTEKDGEVMFFDFVKNDWQVINEEDVMAVDPNISTDSCWASENREDGRHLAWCNDGGEMYLTWCEYTHINDCVSDRGNSPREANIRVFQDIRSHDKAVRDMALYQLYLAFVRPIVHVHVTSSERFNSPNSVADIINNMLEGKHGKGMI